MGEQRRVIRVYVELEDLVAGVFDGPRRVSGLPEGGEVVGWGWDEERRQVEVLVKSPVFMEVEEGKIIPEHRVEIVRE